MSVLKMAGLVSGNIPVPQGTEATAAVEDASIVGKDHFQPTIASDIILS